MQDLKDLVLAGRDLAIHGVTRWRCLDLCAAIADRHGVVVHEPTVGKMLRRMGLTRLQPWPHHPGRTALRRRLLEKLCRPRSRSLPPKATGKRIEIWFQDEAGVGQNGTLSYQWAPRGSRPPAVRYNRHDSAYLFGAIYPARAVGTVIGRRPVRHVRHSASLAALFT